MVRQPLDQMAERGMQLRVFFPHDQPSRLLIPTGVTRPNTSSAPCRYDWELRDSSTGNVEWAPGWYVASRS